MEKVRMGVIGFGNMGSSYIKMLLGGEIEGAVLSAAADSKEARREWLSSIAPEVPVYDDAVAMMDSGKVDAVIIATPHYTHPGFAIEAFKRGLHVLSDKPAGVYTLQVREMVAEAEKHPNLVFGIMFNQRTDCLYRKMKELISSGELGEIKRVSWIITNWYRTQIYYDSGAWRATWAGEGGGVMLNQCPHQMDLITWICGMPEKVRAFCHEGKWHDIEVEDDVTAYFEYPNGATGTFVTSTGDAPGANRFEVTLTKGTLKCEDGKLLLYRLEEDERVFCREAKEGFAMPKGAWEEVETDGRSEQHAGVLKAFAAKILGKGELVAPGAEGLNGLLLSNAIYLSSWTDSTVTIPFDEELYLRLLDERRAKSKAKEGLDITFSTEGTYQGGKA